MTSLPNHNNIVNYFNDLKDDFLNYKVKFFFMLITSKATVDTPRETKLKLTNNQVIMCTQDPVKPDYNRNSSGNLTASIKY